MLCVLEAIHFARIGRLFMSLDFDSEMYHLLQAENGVELLCMGAGKVVGTH